MSEEASAGEPVYLELADALELYAATIGSTVEQAADQLHDRDALEGALARPRAHAHYAGAGLAFQAAVLGHAIAEGQAFPDANKRLALAKQIWRARFSSPHSFQPRWDQVRCTESRLAEAAPNAPDKAKQLPDPCAFMSATPPVSPST